MHEPASATASASWIAPGPADAPGRRAGRPPGSYAWPELREARAPRSAPGRIVAELRPASP